MPFVEVFRREELSDAVRAKLAETLLVTMMNVEIGHPTDHARANVNTVLRGRGAQAAHQGADQNQ